MTPLTDPVAEARRIVEGAEAVGLTVRVVGGVGIALVAPTIGQLRPVRIYHDIDLVAPAGMPPIARLMASLGYGASTQFNTLNGAERLMFHDPAGRRVDVFIDTLRMCHELPFRDRLAAWPWTLPAVDLLLSKLQIVEMTDRDAMDVLALLADQPLTEDLRGGIELPRIREICGRDWGWWRTVDDNLASLMRRWAGEGASGPGPAGPAVAGATDPGASLGAVMASARERAGALREVLEATPKSIGWRMRAAVGPRMRWYDLPEEVR